MSEVEIKSEIIIINFDNIKGTIQIHSWISRYYIELANFWFILNLYFII